MAGRKSALSFGLVYIPIELYAGARPEEISFNQLDKNTMERVHYVKTCPDCKAPLEQDDIVRAYQYEKDRYVTVTDEELEAIKTDKDKTLKITQFCDEDEIPPVYYQKSYQVIAQAGSEKPLELLRRAMVESKKIAVGSAVIGTSENTFALVPYDDELALITLYYESEIQDVPKASKPPKVSKQELKMANDLIKSLERPFDPSNFKDHYQEKLRKLLESKVEGKKIIVEPESGKPSDITDLMDALTASLKTAKPKPAHDKKLVTH